MVIRHIRLCVRKEDYFLQMLQLVGYICRYKKRTVQYVTSDEYSSWLRFFFLTKIFR